MMLAFGVQRLTLSVRRPEVGGPLGVQRRGAEHRENLTSAWAYGVFELNAI
jgi:hypothetical protein